MNNNKYHRTIPKSNIKIVGRGKIYNTNIHIHFDGQTKKTKGSTRRV
jgi:hypothetical protein